MSSLQAPPQKVLDHALEQRKLDAGAFGRFFGLGEQTSKSITAVVVFSLILIGAIATFFKPWNEAAEYWKITFPVVTLGLGYLFGRGQSSE